MNDAATPTAKSIARAAAEGAAALTTDGLNALQDAFDDVTKLSQRLSDLTGLIDAIPEALFDDIGPLRRVKVANAAGDVTTQLQSELDGPERGIPYIGPGVYAIDPRRSLRLHSGQVVIAHPAAVLKAIPHGEEESYVVLADGINDAVWIGGNIIGERELHQFPTFTENNLRTTHEWNHGLRLRRCSRILVRNLSVSMCGGDGVSAGGDDITLDNLVSTRHRRNGLTIGGSNRMRVLRSEFSEMGRVTVNGATLEGAQKGPHAGIDTEPDVQSALDVLIEACIARNNQRPGFLFYAGSSKPVNIAATLRGCRSEGNSNQVEAQATSGSAVTLNLFGNTLRRRPSSGVGVKLYAGANALIGAAADGGKDMNTFIGPPGTDRPYLTRTGTGANTANDIQRSSGAIASVLWNAYD